MLRRITILLLFTAFIPAALQAQVATTDLAPGTMRFIHPNAWGLNSASFTPDNPAALAWGKASLVGGGVVQGTFYDFQVATSEDFDGEYLGFRWVGEFISVAAETHSVKGNDTLNPLKDESTNVHAAFNLGGVLALGVAAEEMFNQGSDIKVERFTAGASLSLNEMFFVGAALMQEKETSSGFDLEREGTMFGVAFRIDGDMQWYGAYDVIDLEDFTYQGVSQFGAIKQDTTTLQVNISNLLLGVGVFNVYPEGATDDVAGDFVEIGWAPEDGLSITVRSLTTKVTDQAAGTDLEKSEMQSLTVAWLF